MSICSFLLLLSYIFILNITSFSGTTMAPQLRNVNLKIFFVFGGNNFRVCKIHFKFSWSHLGNRYRVGDDNVSPGWTHWIFPDGRSGPRGGTSDPFGRRGPVGRRTGPQARVKFSFKLFHQPSLSTLKFSSVFPKFLSPEILVQCRQIVLRFESD